MRSRHWKMQIPYLARHCRVLTFDGRGNGRSDRPLLG
jgi:pimeloyl-ACP methyl ester carboxylesterase